MLSKRKVTMIKRRLEAEPGLSNRALAREFKCDHKTVATIRASLTTGENSPVKPARAGRKSTGQNWPVQTAGGEEFSTPEPATAPATAGNSAVDPRAILEAIAADKLQPATARVAAAKALLGLSKPTETEKAAEKVDKTTARALQLINGGKSL